MLDTLLKESKLSGSSLFPATACASPAKTMEEFEWIPKLEKGLLSLSLSLSLLCFSGAGEGFYFHVLKETVMPTKLDIMQEVP